MVQFRGTWNTLGFWMNFPTACPTWGFGTLISWRDLKMTISGTEQLGVPNRIRNQIAPFSKSTGRYTSLTPAHPQVGILCVLHAVHAPPPISSERHKNLKPVLRPASHTPSASVSINGRLKWKHQSAPLCHVMHHSPLCENGLETCRKSKVLALLMGHERLIEEWVSSN